jgi:hypothetical protein
MGDAGKTVETRWEGEMLIVEPAAGGTSRFQASARATRASSKGAEEPSLEFTSCWELGTGTRQQRHAAARIIKLHRLLYIKRAVQLSLPVSAIARCDGHQTRAKMLPL